MVVVDVVVVVDVDVVDHVLLGRGLQGAIEKEGFQHGELGASLFSVLLLLLLCVFKADRVLLPKSILIASRLRFRRLLSACVCHHRHRIEAVHKRQERAIGVGVGDGLKVRSNIVR